VLQAILRLGLFQKLPYFKKSENSEYMIPYADLLAFLIQVLFVATIFTFLENGVGVLIEKSSSEFLLMVADSVYFVMTTATTVGYGDISPTTLLSKIFVVISIFLFLSARLLKILSRFMEASAKINEFKRIGRLFEMKDDRIIVYCDAENIKRDNFLWLKRFVSENETSTRFKNNLILLVNHNEDASQMLNDAMVANHNFGNRVEHLNINIDEEDFFNKIGIETAEHVYVLGNSEDTHSDSKVFDFAYRVELETKYNKDVTAEIVNDSNRKRMYDVGVDVIMRPNRSYPAMLITATIAPGTATVLEELSSRGGDTLELFNIPENVNDFVWGDLLINLSLDGVGTVIAVVYDNKIDLNPMGNDKIKNGMKIIMMINEMRDKSYETEQQKIHNVFNKIKTNEEVVF